MSSECRKDQPERLTEQEADALRGRCAPSDSKPCLHMQGTVT